MASARGSLDRGAAAPLVCLVDNDRSLLRGFRRLLEAHGSDVEAFLSAEAFLAFPHRARAACLVLDVELGGGLSGLELQEQLRAAGCRIPVIVITGRDDVATRVQAQRAGAAAYLPKPVDDHALIAAIDVALGRG
jgi:FixJ family two-component response regulator